RAWYGVQPAGLTRAAAFCAGDSTEWTLAAAAAGRAGATTAIEPMPGRRAAPDTAGALVTAAASVHSVAGAGGKKSIPPRSPPSLTSVTAVTSLSLVLRISTLPRSQLESFQVLARRQQKL